MIRRFHILLSSACADGKKKRFGFLFYMHNCMYVTNPGKVLKTGITKSKALKLEGLIYF